MTRLGDTKRVISRAHEVEITIAYLGGVPIKTIVAYYNVSRQAVHRVVKRMGYQATRKGGTIETVETTAR